MADSQGSFAGPDVVPADDPAAAVEAAPPGEASVTAPPAEAGSIVLAGTPIGNVEDASPRLRRLLTQADVIAAEDTRRLHALAARLGVTVSGKVISSHEHNEASRAQGLLDVVATGGTVLVVSDAGMPTVSDPGFRVVEAAIERGLRVTTAPGPSAVLAALALSGLPTDRFTFEGFPPRKSGERDRALGRLAQEPRTMVFFESPHRIDKTLDAMAAAFGADRRGALCRELTKTYEEVRRATLGELARGVIEDPPRGEIALVIAGAPEAGPADVPTLVADVLLRTAAGERLKDVAGELAAEHGVAKRDLYEAALVARAHTNSETPQRPDGARL